jgi:N-acylglucosamine 2-epimerase
MTSSHAPLNTTALRTRYETELFERVIPFWERHSGDTQNGGYYNCLDRQGRVFDRTKHVWLQGRQAWMFSKLYRTVEQRPAWLRMARSGIDFLQKHAVRDDGRVYFSLTAEGRPVYMQRKIFSECFYAMALAEYGRAADLDQYVLEAERQLERIWGWAFDWTRVGRPAYPGAPAAQMLAVPMILLNLIEEIAGNQHTRYRTEIDECIRLIGLHIDEEAKVVLENVAPDGGRLDSPEGRLINPGHAIEAGWFLQHWAGSLGRTDLSETAMNMVRWSFDRGWDVENEGIFYFLDVEGRDPVQLEWFMKLWWPHCEALYAHLLNYSLTAEDRDLQAFQMVDAYTFSHFPDPEFGEWYGYLDRQVRPTHTFKGGPYKGCFHVPRALWLCWNLLTEMENGPGNR